MPDLMAPLAQIATLERHMALQHPNQPHPFRCPRCDKAVKGNGKQGRGTIHLQRHLRIHNPSFRLLGCSVCSTGFFHEGNLGRHAKRCDGRPPTVAPSRQRMRELKQPVVAITVDPAASGLALRCTRCGDTFTHASFSSHPCPVPAPRPLEPRPRFRCARCQETFLTRGTIR